MESENNSDNKDERGFKVRDMRGQENETDPVEDVKMDSEPKASEQPSAGEPQQQQAPQIDFPTFVISMSTSAMVHMGLIEDPHTKSKTKNLDVARQEIDIISMLNEKTRGNLSPEEEKMMRDILYELRMRFVDASKSA